MVQSVGFWLALLLGPMIYWQLPKRFRGWALVAISILAVGFEHSDVLIYPFLAVIFYIGARHLDHGGKIRVLGLIAAMLVLFRPVVVPAAGIALVPMGVSYIAFRYVHLAIEIVRGNVVLHSLKDMLVWTTFMPILSAGPIERYDHFWESTEDHFHWGQVAEGGQRILIGVIKKGLVAELLVAPLFYDQAPFWDEGAGMLEAWVFILSSFFYAYMDFSAYSDIAVGASRLFGFRVMENFNFPMFAVNPGDFWRRWHMSLMEFCRTYIYMPILGRTRNPYLAVLVTFVVMAFWHDVTINRFLWGLWHAGGIAIAMNTTRQLRKRKLHKRFETKPWMALSALATWLFVSSAHAFVMTNHLGPKPALKLLSMLVGF